jgi:hypothetical protein
MRLTPALLTSAAALALASTAASAADLPTKKAAPVEYVRVCSVHGEGFWYIPGTDTCIRVGGRVRAEFGAASTYNVAGAVPNNGPLGTIPTELGPFPIIPGENAYLGTFIGSRNQDATGFYANGRLFVDARTSTEWGTLRAYIRYDFNRNSGVYGPGYFYSQNNGPSLDRAYVQWAGITAGFLESAFGFYQNDLNWSSIAGADFATNQFRYTATFGAGFSASISIEDQTYTKGGLITANPVALYSVFNGDLYYTGATALGGYLYAGTRVPDIVANLRVDQGWGSAQLSGALHQNRWASYPGNFLAFPGLGAGIGETNPDGEWGYAIQAGVKINLPMLAAGDVLWLQAAYASGASTYLGTNNIPFSIGYTQGVAADQVWFPVYNAEGALIGTNTKSVTGWALTAAGLHYWTPTIRQALFGSYLKLNGQTSSYYNATGSIDGGPFGYEYGPGNTTVWQVGTNLIWSPVSGLDIGAEVGYINVKTDNEVPYATFVSPATESAGYLYKNSDNRFYGRLRIQREF